MTTLQRYLLREFALTSAAVLAGLLMTWFAADALLHIGQLGSEPGRALLDMGARGLEVVPLGVPLACTLGIAWSLTQAVRSREITAIRCGGVPLRRALLPILACALVLGIALAFFEDRVLVPTKQAVRAATLSDGDSGGAVPTEVDDRWWYASSESVFSAKAFDGPTQQLLDVTVFEFDAERAIKRRIEAESAANPKGERWEFRNAIIYDFTAPEGFSLERVQNLSVALGLSGADLERVRRPPALETLHGLSRALERPGGDPTLRRAREAAFHTRLAATLTVLVLVLLVIPIAIGDAERGQSQPRALVFSICWAGGYYLLWTLGIRTAASGAVPAFVPLWSVALATLALGGWRYIRIKE